MIRLRSYDISPPGSYFYVQNEGIRRKFGPVPSIEDLAKSVAAFRRGNSLPRASVAEALFDIDTFTCARLGNPPGFCVDSESPIGAGPTFPAAAPCAGCGAKA